MRVAVIALNTFKEAVRDRILYAILVFALVMLAGSTILVTISVDGEEKIIKDLGLACISIFGLLIATFLGTGLVSKEIEKRTLYTIISKPIHRYQFILGKYLGLVMTLLVNVGVMGLGLIGLAYIWEGTSSVRLLLAVLFIFLELVLVTAIAMLFSAFSSPALSALFTLCLFVAGHLSADLRLFAAQFGGAATKLLAEVLFFLLPNLSRLNLKDQTVHGIAIDGGTMALSVVYAIFYVAALVLAAMAIFQRRDFK
ncbi:MAG: ABC transporter permease [Candidatus Methylomirabilis oxyfera]|nr:ABC transporter permease [Candidatus Methylomirabilis oxyfera]